MLRGIDPAGCQVNPYDANCPSASDWNPAPIMEAEAICKAADRKVARGYLGPLNGCSFFTEVVDLGPQ